MSTATCPSKYLLQAGWSELELETTGWHPHTLKMDKRNIIIAVLLIIQVLCKKYTDSVCVCTEGPYLYDLLQGTQPGNAMLLKQITGAFLHQHGEQTEPLKPECKQVYTWKIHIFSFIHSFKSGFPSMIGVHYTYGSHHISFVAVWV